MADTKVNVGVSRQGGRVVVSFSEAIDFLALAPAEANQLAIALAHFAAGDDQALEHAEVRELLQAIGKPNA
jgi:hypothetical protein